MVKVAPEPQVETDPAPHGFVDTVLNSKLETAGLFPDCGDFSWVDDAYRERLEGYLRARLKTRYWSDYDKFLLRSHMNAVMDMLYYGGMAEQYVPVRAFETIISEEFEDAAGLIAACKC